MGATGRRPTPLRGIVLAGGPGAGRLGGRRPVRCRRPRLGCVGHPGRRGPTGRARILGRPVPVRVADQPGGLIRPACRLGSARCGRRRPLSPVRILRFGQIRRTRPRRCLAGTLGAAARRGEPRSPIGGLGPAGSAGGLGLRARRDRSVGSPEALWGGWLRGAPWLWGAGGGVGLGGPALGEGGLAGTDAAVDRVIGWGPQLLIGVRGRGPGIGGPRRPGVARHDGVPAVHRRRRRRAALVGRRGELGRRRLRGRHVLRAVRLTARRRPHPALLCVPPRERVGQSARTLPVVVGRILASAHRSLPSSATDVAPLQAVQPR